MKTQLNTLLNRVDTRLAACAAAAGASLAVVPSSDAVIVYSGVVNLNIAATTNGLYLNVVTGAINEPGNTGGSSVPGWDINPYGSTSLTLFNPAAPAGGVYQGSANNFNLALGTLVSAAGPFSSGIFSSAPNFNSSNNYVGFRFLNEATGITNYGWFQISLGATITAPRAVVGYAYENTGASINVGNVPEPSTFALLGVMAAGALGVRAWRGRKAA